MQQKSGFARPVAAEKNNRFTGFKPKIYAVQGHGGIFILIAQTNGFDEWGHLGDS
jgi:hypothetical protein